MTARHSNLVGALAWIATRDPEASDDLNAAWDRAKTELERIVAAVYLTQASSNELLGQARDNLRAACTEGKIGAIGWKRGESDTADVPIASWLDVEINEAAGTIGRGMGDAWLGIRFLTANVRTLWPVPSTASLLPPRKPTGPRARYREEIKRILDLVDQAELNALERGDSPESRPTNKQIAEKLSERHGCTVSERTVCHNVNRLGGNVNRKLGGMK